MNKKATILALPVAVVTAALGVLLGALLSPIFVFLAGSLFAAQFLPIGTDGFIEAMVLAVGPFLIMGFFGGYQGVRGTSYLVKQADLLFVAKGLLIVALVYGAGRGALEAADGFNVIGMTAWAAGCAAFLLGVRTATRHMGLR